MNFLSKEKLNLQKAKKNMTNLQIAKMANIPLSNIDKIFSGKNKNPTLDTIQKIAQVLDCSIDDFIQYDIEPKAPYYIDRKTKTIADMICDDDHLKNLLIDFLKLNIDDIKLIEHIIERFKD